MTKRFNPYAEAPEMNYWRELCLSEGERCSYARGEEFVREGEVGRFVGLVISGAFKYVARGEDGAEHVVGLDNEFVADFPFSLHGQRSRVSIVAATACDVYRYPVKSIVERMKTDRQLETLVAYSSELLFSQTYDRYMDLYCKSPQERYKDLISKHPDLFALFSLKDIASYLNITPTHLSRLRKNV